MRVEFVAPPPHRIEDWTEHEATPDPEDGVFAAVDFAEGFVAVPDGVEDRDGLGGEVGAVDGHLLGEVDGCEERCACAGGFDALRGGAAFEDAEERG